MNDHNINNLYIEINGIYWPLYRLLEIVDKINDVPECSFPVYPDKIKESVSDKED